MEFIFWMAVIGVIAYHIVKAVNRYEQAQKMNEMQQNDPQGWLQLQQIEHERQMMAHQQRMLEQQEKERNRSLLEKAWKIGWEIGKRWK